MGCYSREFTIEILRAKPYFARLSSYLIEQLVRHSCDQLSRFCRAVDALESGAACTKFPGSFHQAGFLAGYGHVHYLQPDWAATNMAVSNRLPLGTPLDQAIDAVAERIVAGNDDVFASQDQVIGKFVARLKEGGTGDWIIYRDAPAGREYLAVHKHTVKNSPEEKALQQLLDAISI